MVQDGTFSDDIKFEKDNKTLFIDGSVNDVTLAGEIHVKDGRMATRSRPSLILLAPSHCLQTTNTNQAITHTRWLHSDSSDLEDLAMEISLEL